MAGCKEEEMRLRMKQEWSAFRRMNIVFKSNFLLCLKKKAYDQCVLPVMTYGCETWMLQHPLHTEKHGKMYAWYNKKRSKEEYMGKEHDQSGRYSSTM
jgi:hypothetical protein